MAENCFCIPGFPSSSLTDCMSLFLFIFSIFWPLGGSNLAKNGYFSAVFSSDRTTCTFTLLMSYAYPKKLELRRVTEIGLK